MTTLTTHFHHINDLHQAIGKEVGVSEWLKIEQEQINQFAIATRDLQWIHTNPEKAAKDSPFGKTIAHGFLSLSLLPYFMYACLIFEHSKLTVNYGLNRVRFTAPVLVGSEIRARFTIQQVSEVKGGVQVELSVTMDVKEQEKPALIANFIILIYED